MNGLPSVTLLQQINARKISGEELETLGKHAASLYSRGKTTLTNAVIETVKKAGLSPEQVKRVTEFANTAAYLEEFHKLGSAHRVVEFRGGPADIGRILQDLNDGGGGTVFDRGDNDYRMPPKDVAKLATVNRSRLGITEDKLAQAFGVEEVPLPYADPLRDAWEMKEKVAAAYAALSDELSGLETVYYDLSESLFHHVKQAALSGTTLGQVVAAWRDSVEEPEYVKVAFQVLAPRLLSNGVFASKLAIAESLEKCATVGVTNTKHSLVSTFNGFCEVLTKMAHVRSARDELVAHADALSTFLNGAMKKQADGGVVGKVMSVAPKVWRGVTGTTAVASVPAAKAGRVIGGNIGEKVLGGAVKYSPHIALGLAAEDTYQRAKYSPASNAAKNFILSRVPYTHPWMVRQYQMQMGGG